MAQSHTSFTFTATTTSPGFNDEQVLAICEWAKSRSDSCCVVEETSTHRHLHGVFRVKQKQTGQVTRMFATLYKKMDLPWVPTVSVKVKKTTELIGWFHYILKQNKPLVLTGWKMTWITEQCQANVKLIPRRILRKGRPMLQPDTVVATILAFMDAHNMPIMDKSSFIAVVTTMQKDQYNFMKVRKPLVYEAVMAELGILDVAAAAWENELQFLP